LASFQVGVEKSTPYFFINNNANQVKDYELSKGLL